MFEFAPVSDRIRRIREKKNVFTGGKYITINSERTKIYTDYCRAHDNEFPVLKRAGAFYTWCQSRKITVFDDDIFVGTPGPDERTLSCPRSPVSRPQPRKMAFCPMSMSTATTTG